MDQHSAARSVSLLGSLCKRCQRYLRQGRASAGRYRSFLLDPATLFSLATLMLLGAAGMHTPAGLAGSADAAHSHTSLYLAAALVGSLYIWWSAIQGLREGDFTADVPVSLATIAALAIGEYSAAAVVAALLLLGGVIESFVAARLSQALDALAKLLPDRVTARRDEQDVSLPLGELSAGDVILVRPGERIAVDGTVLAGQAEVNQAAITGESQTVTKSPGDTVYAGTLSTVGALEIRADRVGEETTLGQIRRMVASAQVRKAPIERLLDRWARLYTPAAILLGLVLWWWGGDMLRAITALIVFCPCVMVLATPTALAAVIGNAALRGTLIKKGATVEALAGVNAVAFDKTGTLTRGALHLVEVVPLNGMPEAELLHLAAGAEKYSEHPLGGAVALTSAGILTPVTGALLHELASLPVIANSARLIGAADRSGLRSGSAANRAGCQARP